MTPNRAANIIGQITRATTRPVAMNNGKGPGQVWIVESEKLDAPEAYDDAGLIDFAGRLEKIFA